MDHRDTLRWNYIADTLFYKGENKRLTQRLIEILDPAPPVPQLTQEQILDNLKKGGINIV